MHLRTADAFGDLSLGEVIEKPKSKDGPLPLRQSGNQGTDRFDAEHLIQVRIHLTDAVREASVIGTRSQRRIC